MADAFLGLTELLKLNDLNLADIEVTDLLDDAPFLRSLAAGEASNGTQHKYLKETGAPVVGFRDPNDGRENKKSADELVTINLKILDASFAVDKAIAEAFRRGWQQFVAREALRHIRAAFFHAEQQLFYGSDLDAKGFVGLSEAEGLSAVEDVMVVDAEGTTAATASSVWLVRTNDAGVDCTVIAGEDAKITIGESVIQRIAGATTGTLPAYYTPITGWLGLQIGSAYSVGRICNLTEDNGHTLTDDLIYDALSRFPASRQPNLIVMNRRSLRQLRESRTATNATGAPAPRPTDVEGIPIITTDALSNTEAVIAEEE